MKGVKLLSVIGIAVCVIAMVSGIAIAPGCAKAPAPTAPTTPAKVYELAFCVQHPYQDPMVCIINEAQKKWLWAESDGRIRTTIIPSAAAVASAAELYDAARTGVVEMACHCTVNTWGRFTLADVITLPAVTTWPSSLQVGMTLRELFKKYPEIQKECSSSGKMGHF